MDINAAGYLYPDLFWKFDYSIGVKEALENISPTVHGKQLAINGEGHGYLKYKARLSSATLGTFTSSCLVDISACQSGITSAFWVKLEMVVTSSDGEYQLLTVKPTGYGKKNPIVQVWYTVENVHISLNVMVHSNVRISFKKAVHAGEWYHVIIQRNAGSSQNELSTFVNLSYNMTPHTRGYYWTTILR